MAKNEVKIIISANSTGLKTGIKDAQGHIASLAEKSSALLNQMKANWLAVVGTIAGAGYTVKKVTDEIDAAFGRLDRRLSFENLALSVGRNAEQIVRDVRRASGDILSLQDTIDATGRAILLGLESNTITKLMEIARASTKVTGQSISQAFDDITLGVARQSKMILDNLGIMLDYDKHLKVLALSLGKTESQLTDTDRRQAFLNATFESGEVMVKRIGNSYNDLSERLKQAKAHLSDVTNEMKDQIFLNEGETAVKFYEDLAYTIEHQYIPIIKLLQKAYDSVSESARKFHQWVIYPISGVEIGKRLDELVELRENYKKVKEIQKENRELAESLQNKRLENFENAFAGSTDTGYKEVRQQYEKDTERQTQFNKEMQRTLDIVDFLDDAREELLKENERRKQEEIRIASEIRQAYESMYDALGFDAKGYYDFRKGLLEKQRDEEVAITGDITLAWEAYYARQRELENERIRHSGSPMEGVQLFFDEESRKPQSWATEVEGGLADLKQGMKNATYSIVRDTESIGDAFKNMAMSILDSIAKIGTNMLVNSLFSMVGGALAGGVASGVSGAGTGTIGASYTGGAGTSGGTVGYNGMTGFTANSMSGGGTPIINNYITNNNNDIRANDVDSFRKLLRQNRGTLNEITVEGKRKNRNFEKQLKG